MQEGMFLKHSEGLFEHCYFTVFIVASWALVQTLGLRASTEWRKTASSTISVYACGQKSCWLREINVLLCIERKNWWWSHVPICVWGKACVLAGYMVESKHIPILRFRHALKSLKLSWSLGSNCGLNSSYFSHTDVLGEKEREILNSIFRLPARSSCVYHLFRLWHSNHSPNLD